MTQSLLSLEGCKTIVTGAMGKQGISRAIALAMVQAEVDFASEDVYLKGDDFDLEGTALAVRHCRHRSISIQVDSSDRRSVDHMIQRTVSGLGGLDIQVNNAASGAMSRYLEVTPEQWDKTMETNLRGCHNCCQAAFLKKQNHGNIINTSSTSGFHYTPNQYAYGVSKAGIIQATRWLSEELMKYNIRVNCIAPGWWILILTNMISRVRSRPPYHIRRMQKDTLDRRP